MHTQLDKEGSTAGWDMYQKQKRSRNWSKTVLYQPVKEGLHKRQQTQEEE